MDVIETSSCGACGIKGESGGARAEERAGGFVFSEMSRWITTSWPPLDCCPSGLWRRRHHQRQRQGLPEACSVPLRRVRRRWQLPLHLHRPRLGPAWERERQHDHPPAYAAGEAVATNMPGDRGERHSLSSNRRRRCPKPSPGLAVSHHRECDANDLPTSALNHDVPEKAVCADHL
ncbi:unnamed protein product, partial [Pylaiella littoralis]